MANLQELTKGNNIWEMARSLPILPIATIVLLLFVGIFAPLISPYPPLDGDLDLRNANPSWLGDTDSPYFLGGDHIGRDILTRIMYGTRISLMVAGTVLIFGTLVGTILGLLSGYIGGLLDEFIMRLVDIFFGIPFVLLAMVVGVVLGANLTTMVVMLALVTWSAFVRNIRAEVLSIRERDYVSLARVAGASTLRILLKHVLPGVINTVVVIATLRSGQLILTEAFLSFVGAGIPPPTPTWGGMIADGRNYLRDAWWISFFPGLFIFLIVLALNFIGDWLRDKLDPRLRQSS